MPLPLHEKNKNISLDWKSIWSSGIGHRSIGRYMQVTGKKAGDDVWAVEEHVWERGRLK